MKVVIHSGWMTASPEKHSGLKPWIFIRCVARQTTSWCGERDKGQEDGPSPLSSGKEWKKPSSTSSVIILFYGCTFGFSLAAVTWQQLQHHNTVTRLSAVTIPPLVRSQHCQYGHRSTSEVTATLRCLTKFHGWLLSGWRWQWRAG